MGMTYYEAALKVLESAGRPLGTREITVRAMDAGLIMPRGKTPHATMSAQLYKHLPHDARLVKLGNPGNGRAKRDSVRWTLHKDSSIRSRALRRNSA